MKTERIGPPTAEAGYFFVIVNLLVGVAILMAAISLAVMFYGGLQFVRG